jgi:hypothetical protein
VAFTEKVARRAGVPMRWWLRLQAVMFPVLTCLLVALGWQFYLHPRFVLRTSNAFEGGALLLRYVLWTAFITTHFGLATSAGIYLAYNWFAADSIFLNFAVSHTHLPTVAAGDNVDWVRHPARLSDPQEQFLGPKKIILTVEIPCRTHVSGPSNIPGGRDRARRSGTPRCTR